MTKTIFKYPKVPSEIRRISLPALKSCGLDLRTFRPKIKVATYNVESFD